VPDKPGVAGKIFSKLAEECINVDMIIQNIQYNNLNDITFTVNQEQLNKSEEIIENMIKMYNFGNVEIDEKVAKVSIVGAGMISTPGIAAKMFQTLGDAGINIQMITTSEIKISCLIKKELADKAVNVLHDEFSLDKVNN